VSEGRAAEIILRTTKVEKNGVPFDRTAEEVTNRWWGWLIVVRGRGSLFLVLEATTKKKTCAQLPGETGRVSYKMTRDIAPPRRRLAAGKREEHRKVKSPFPRLRNREKKIGENSSAEGN